MKYLFATSLRGGLGLKPAQCAVVVLAGLTAGCSADVARFDSSSFNLNDPPQTAANPPPVRTASDLDHAVTRSQPRGPYGAGAGSLPSPQGGVEVAALPDATPPPVPVQPARATSRWAATPQAPAPMSSPAGAPAQTLISQPAVAASGQSIDVQPGDTLYGLSKKHHVSVAALMSVNQLTTPNLKPGQKLVLPMGNGPRKPLTRPAAVAAAPVAPPSADVAAKYSGTYTVKPGDSLYSIARAHKVQVTELQQVNGITDPRKVRPGVSVKVPSGLGGAVAAAEAASAPVAAAASQPPAAVAEAPRNIHSTTQPTAILNGGKQQVAALNDKANDAQPATTAAIRAPAAKPEKAAPAVTGDSSKLRWPVAGKVIAGFGGRPDGTHNDGINLSVPLGTEVHAAEGGVVAYAGSELKGYGNLVLVRHDNGWVTAYAHNDELLVKRGDKVTRGQVIGKAGKTGTVEQPQVHFELRQGSKPVDPTPFMEKS
jgi:murein DD-endopeptidase MepM/ murein hydrolase activator NlpD